MLEPASSSFNAPLDISAGFERRWAPPLNGDCIILNVDGSFHRDRGMSSGGFFHNVAGSWRGGFSAYDGPGMIVESDCQDTIKVILGDTDYNDC
ncbi:STAS domain-containing protein [Sesbania bispinosa]|nr:STAS domain-containing protein [Sesbania bispinosa]